MVWAEMLGKKMIKTIFNKQTLLLSVLLVFLTSCVAENPKQSSGPRVTAKLVKDDGKNQGVSIKEVLEIAANRAEISCIELTLGSLQAYVLKSIGNPNIVKADKQTQLLAGAIGGNADKLIDQERKCHCDRGVAMPGYEIFERRNHLQKNKKNRILNQSYIQYYPKDENGQPRFLRNGEKIDRSILMRLPEAPKMERFDDCGSKCKKARANVNAEARAAGKPEPWPNLQHPRKKPCINGVPQDT